LASCWLSATILNLTLIGWRLSSPLLCYVPVAREALLLCSTAGRKRFHTLLQSKFTHFFPAKTINDVIVHHTNGLHKGIAYGGTGKRKSQLLQLLAHHI